MRTVLAILGAGFEEIEAVTPIDLLRRAGAEVTLASLDDNLSVEGRSGLILKADMSLSAARATDQQYDCIFLPGGPGTKKLRASSVVRELLEEQNSSGRWIAAICAAPTVLFDAGLLAGRRYTAHPSVSDELPAVLGDQRVVRDGNLLTSRGAGTALDFGLALVEILFSAAVTREIAHAIAA